MQFCKLLFVKLQILDVAVSLAKVADVDRSLGNEEVAVNGFQEAITLLETLKLKSEDAGLEQRVRVPCFDRVICSLDPEKVTLTYGLFPLAAPFSA